MFEPTSRYFALRTVTHQSPGGREIAYKRRRFLPRAEALLELVEVTVSEADRLDGIAHRTLGDAEKFWQLADANDAMHPATLTEVPGRRLRIAMPQPNP